LRCATIKDAGVLIVDFDEAAASDTTHVGGHVACVLWGSGGRRVLRTQLELLGLSNPPGAAVSAPLMNEFFIQT
jgi:hypothetical protein